MKRVVVLLLVIGVAVAAAAFRVPSNAGTVNGVGIGQSSFNADLVAIANSTDFQCYLDARIVVQSQGQVNGLPIFGVASSQANPQNFTTDFAGYWLGQRINSELLEQMAAARHLTITPADLTFGRQDLSDTIGATIQEVAGTQFQTCTATGSQVLASMPVSFVNGLVLAQAAGDAVEASSAGYALRAGTLAAYYAAHRATFETVCLSGIQATSSAQATTYRNQLVAGTPFAQVAASAGATNGGVIGCISPSNAQSFESVQSIVGALKVGQISQPFDDRGTYVVLQVTARKPSTYAAATEVVRAAVLAAGATKAGLSLEHKVETSEVAVDPLYGHWVHGSSIAIAPPPSPPTASVLNPTANVAPKPATPAPVATPVPGAAGAG
jgi:hypothetical protein